MVVYPSESDEADRVFRALADATRRDIVRRVIAREQPVSALADRYAMSFAAVQKHVAVLERAGLVAKQRVGRTQVVRAEPAAITRARALLDQLESLWRDRIASIDDLLAEHLEEGN